LLQQKAIQVLDFSQFKFINTLALSKLPTINPPMPPPPSLPENNDSKGIKLTGNDIDNMNRLVGVAGLFVGGVEYSHVANGKWAGANGKWYSLKWGGNQWTGARSSAQKIANVAKYTGRGLFVVSSFISGIQGASAWRNDDYAGAAKYGMDIGMSAFATFGGPPAWVIGGGYLLFDATGVFSTPWVQGGAPMRSPDRDNTYVAPPTLVPRR
jgi:hypothetical protein